MSQLNVGALSGIASTVDQINLSTGHTLQIDGNLKFNHTGGNKLPSGTTAERPVSPQAGYFRFNTSTNSFEIHTGKDWINIGASAGSGVGTYASPASSGRKIKQSGAASGYYWIQPIGYDEPRYCYVDNDNYDGGWVLINTIGSSGTNHYDTFESSNLYNATVDGVNTNYVPFSGSGYSSSSTRKHDDNFVKDLMSHMNGGEEIFNIRIARNGAQPPGGVYDTYNGGTTTDWRYASFIRYRGGCQYWCSLNTGGDNRQGDREEGVFSVSHVYPFNWEKPGGWGHIRLYNNSYKVWDYHSNPSNYQTSRYGNNRVLFGYTGNTSNGIYGGSASFTGSNQGNPGYLFVR